MSQRLPRVLRFIAAELQPSAGGSRATVTLEHQPGVDSVGVAATEGGTDLDRHRCVAEATSEALLHAVGAGDDALDIEGVSVVETLGRTILFVAVAAHYEGESRQLLGFSQLGSDPAKAAALAVLNATNRFLAVG